MTGLIKQVLFPMKIAQHEGSSTPFFEGGKKGNEK